jgi:hypothetical protein
MDRWLKTGTVRVTEVPIETNGGGRQALVPPNLDKPFCSKSSASVNNAKKRKYWDEYLNLGFVQAGTDIEQKPQCVLCYEIFSNEAMKPAKLLRHLKTKYSEVSGKSIEFFKIKSNEMKKSKKKIEKIAAGTTN